MNSTLWLNKINKPKLICSYAVKSKATATSRYINRFCRLIPETESNVSVPQPAAIYIFIKIKCKFEINMPFRSC